MFLAAIFLFLPFLGERRLFSMQVDPEWVAGSQARHITRMYQLAVVVVSALCVGFALLSGSHHPRFIYVVPVLEIFGLVSAWSWGWTRTRPFRLQHPITRTAGLRTQPAAHMALWCTLAALLPILGSAAFLFPRYQAIPASFAIHFSAEGVPNHVVPRSWVSVFGPIAIGAGAVLLLVGILRLVQLQGAGVADNGRYSALTRWYVAGVAWIAAFECSGAALLPVVPHPGTYATHLGVLSGLPVLALLLVTTGVLFRNKAILVSGQNATVEAHWKGGLLYFNREDGALFVPKRLGFGWTLNMARPSAWIVMALALAVPLLAVALKHL